MTFQKQQETPIQSLDMVVQEFTHPSGMRHIHLLRKDSELGFSVGFRTNPKTSNGVPHILEHLTLSGSESYPVKDPFFLMLPRSVASFMNAMTYPDRTVYPFNTPNIKDFHNLMSVYLDATFFPRLDKLDFLREGWRYEVERDENNQRQLTLQGVVYNEMKGVYDNPQSIQFDALTSQAFPETTYAIKSGGDPEVIPELSYEELLRFHHDHYHPSRSVVVTYGDIDAKEIQLVLEEKVLSKFKGEVLPPLENENFKMVNNQTQKVTFQSDEEADYAFNYVWPRGLMTDNKATFIDLFMSNLLLTSSSSPFFQKLSNLGYGQPSPLSHYESDLFKTYLSLGFSGLNASEVEKAKKDFWNILNEVASEGVSKEMFEASIRKFEMQIRDTESSYPFGFTLISDALTQALFGGSVAKSLNSQALLDEVRSQLTIENAKKWLQDLINAPHASVEMIPDPKWLEKRAEKELTSLEKRSADFSEKDWLKIEKTQEEVMENQSRPSKVETLPMIKVEDISKTAPALLPIEKRYKDNHATHHHIHVDGRGVGELSLILDSSSLSQEDWTWASLWSQLVSKMGTSDLTWQQHAQKLATEGSNINVNYMKLKDINQPQDLRTIISITGLSLENRVEHLSSALIRLWGQANWNDVPRLQFILQSLSKSVLASPGNLISSDLGKGISIFSNFDSAIDGPAAIPFILSVNEMLQNNPQDVVQKLNTIQEKIKKLPVLVRTIGGPTMASYGSQLQTALGALPAFNPEDASEKTVSMKEVNHSHVAWSVPQQVGEMYQVFNAPEVDNPDFSKVKVLMKVLSNGYLHTAIREKGGAYGANAASTNIIVLSSYRDPRVKGTFEDFKKGIEWVQKGQFEKRQIQEGILSVVKNLDTPRTPRIKAILNWTEHASNLPDSRRQSIREELLSTTFKEVKEVAEKWLSTPSSRLACLPNNKLDEAHEIGFEVKDPVPSKTKKLKLN